MKWLLSTYTIRCNRRHKVFGHLFSGRYKALPVDGSGSGCLRTACDYVHLNPVRPKWLRVGRVLGECGIPKTVPRGGGSLSKEWKAAGPAMSPNSRRSSGAG